MSEKSKVFIVCAACKLENGLIITGPRHWDKLMHEVAKALALPPRDYARADQGFVDQFGTFYIREEAAKAALAAGQVKRHTGAAHILFSEDLY